MNHFLHSFTVFPDSARKSRSYSLGKLRRPLIFLFTVGCLTSVVGYRFYNQPKLAVGTISPVTIIAPEDARFQDQETTALKRQKIRAGLLPRLKRDPQTTDQIERSLRDTLGQLSQISPILRKNSILMGRNISNATMETLLTFSAAQWSTLQSRLNYEESFTKPLTKEQEYAVSEIQAYRQRVAKGNFEQFIDRLGQLRQIKEQTSQNYQHSSLNKLKYADLITVAQMGDREWPNLETAILQASRRILVQGIPPGISTSHLQDTIAVQISSDRLTSRQQSLAENILLAALEGQANLIEDREATKEQATKAVEAVDMVMSDAQAGQIIVKAGETITQAQFVLIDGFGLSERGINWMGLGSTAILVTSAIGTFCLVSQRLHRPLRHRDFLLLGLLSFTTPILAIAHIPFTNLAAVGLLLSSFYGPTLAVTQVLLTAGLSLFSIQGISADLIAGTIGGLLAAMIAAKLRSRDELSLLGMGIGVSQGGVYLLTYLIVSATASTVIYTLLPTALVYGLSGIAWTVIALGLSPYLERCFDVVTPIRLVELSNPNCSLLKRLATEAPGTFQHTLFVACLAEAAARKLHCNVELIRTGTLYHDIGKMHDPLGFIENQMGGPNKHDEINDPYVSAEIIKKHVSEGLVMARRHGLPRVVRDFIPEHQGNLLISYFYQQALQKSAQNGQELVDEAAFRYDGPIPQSRETAIVMLADSSEAALRSLKEASPEQAMDMIKKIFQARWRDQQLVDSGIRQEELPIIAEVFVQVWQQFHHQRIAYPKAVLEVSSAKKI
ncbi:MAG: HDIG domain-containing protein [Microcystis sp. M_OC_Ca_00000000_S217Cul]|uniref:HDIG domain-containing protein n=1 Tax=Microcystis aeruginosa BLCC-F108 TaxID=2755317 RepID=A0A841UWT2_MICAE|nr:MULTISPECIES: HDIG domain-containing metalloprotein [Microcystis]MBC1192516.1 HDIG domain-containing protein [Microcystis aeruginosa BLCC-F108]MCA2591369.1 HDIG domain-containing protein [Microcystis sp. M31BS1]TRT76150.1 MAG: HDIG domain-containing protein [Microcystis sp. M_OC_Ca_00000000_S217Cul]TRT90148.1 MAG: HDIG domain-containing protein [Microcystis sp. M_OC_Ca_00000000_C217Col]